MDKLGEPDVTKQLLLVTFCDTNAGIESGTGHKDNGPPPPQGQTDVNVEIVT